MRRREFFAGLAALRPLSAQNELALQSYFVNQAVTVRVDMPADDSGIDLYAAREFALDPQVTAERCRKHGIGLAQGTLARVTHIEAKSKHVEFHLNGGGFTARQQFALPGLDSTYWGFTDEERRLKNGISSARDKRERERRQSAYDRVRRRRVEPLRRQLERERRLQSGSRFNLRFEDAAQVRALTPEQVKQALSRYVTFGLPGLVR
jgi:hypothetical protein